MENKIKNIFSSYISALILTYLLISVVTGSNMFVELLKKSWSENQDFLLFIIDLFNLLLTFTWFILSAGISHLSVVIPLSFVFFAVLMLIRLASNKNNHTGKERQKDFVDNLNDWFYSQD